MQIECMCVRREMACCAGLDRLEQTLAYVGRLNRAAWVINTSSSQKLVDKQAFSQSKSLQGCLEKHTTNYKVIILSKIRLPL